MLSRAGDNEQYSAFTPGSSKVQLGFLVSLYLLGQEFAPTVHVRNCFSSHTVSLHFVALGEMCPGVNIAALQKEPKFQLVSVSSWQEGAPGVCVWWTV